MVFTTDEIIKATIKQFLTNDIVQKKNKYQKRVHVLK